METTFADGDPLLLALAALAVFAGGVLKGATGAGAPIFAIPALSMVFGVPVAIALMVVPNTLSNVWQAWLYRHDLPDRRYLLHLVVGAFLGAISGTALLALAPAWALSLVMACAVLAYVAVRLLQPDLRLDPRIGRRLGLPVGFLGGALQGATGISAPATLTYLNAMRLARGTFVATASVLFTAMTVMQGLSLVAVDLLPLPLFLGGFIALALLLAGMPLGGWLGRRLSMRAFDRAILALLTLLSLRLLFDAFHALIA